MQEQTQATFCGFCCLTCHCPCGLESNSGNYGGDERGDFLYRHMMDLPMSGRPGLCPAWWNGPLKRMMTASHLAAKQTCDPSFRLRLGMRGSPEAERAVFGCLMRVGFNLNKYLPWARSLGTDSRMRQDCLTGCNKFAPFSAPSARSNFGCDGFGVGGEGAGFTCSEEMHPCNTDKECCSYRCRKRGFKHCRCVERGERMMIRREKDAYLCRGMCMRGVVLVL